MSIMNEVAEQVQSESSIVLTNVWQHHNHIQYTHVSINKQSHTHNTFFILPNQKLGRVSICTAEPGTLNNFPACIGSKNVQKCQRGLVVGNYDKHGYKRRP